MRAKNESNYSFLIALARQLADALEDDSLESVAIAVASLATSLGVLLADGSDEAGEDAGSVDDGEDGDDLAGDDPQVVRGDSPEFAQLEQRVMERLRAELVASSGANRRLVGGGRPTAAHDAGPPPGGTPVLRAAKRSRKKGARRGKK